MSHTLFFSILLAGSVLLADPAAAQLVTNEDELQAAIANAEPGDTIVMADGTWTDVDIVFRADGAEADSIRLVAQTPGAVILNGESSLRIGGDYLVVDGLRFEGGTADGAHVIQFRDGAKQANHSRLTNSTVVDIGVINPNFDTKWISLYGTYNRVDHNYVAGKTNVGTTLVVWLETGSSHEPTFHRIDYNHFGPRPPLGQNEGETIRIGTSTTSMQDAFVTVERNLFEECSGEAEIISNKSGQNVFRGNTFVRSRGALTLRHGNGALVEGNTFFGQRRSETGGVRVSGEDHVIINNYFEFLAGTGFESAIALVNGVPNSPLNRYFQVRNVTIAHNTIIRADDALTIGAGADSERTLPPEDVRFHNNVILSEGDTIVDEEAEAIGMTWDGTVYWGGSLGIDDPPGVTEVNPLIAPSDDELWRPLEGSPLFDAAVAMPDVDVAVDVDGQPRDDQPDIGADERSEDPISVRPLTAADVGPTWEMGTPAESAPAGGSSLILGAPYPNPSAHIVTIPLAMPSGRHVEVAVYDVLGRRVAFLFDGISSGDTSALRFDPKGLAPGRYSVVARTASTLTSAPLTILPSR